MSYKWAMIHLLVVACLVTVAAEIARIRTENVLRELQSLKQTTERAFEEYEKENAFLVDALHRCLVGSTRNTAALVKEVLKRNGAEERRINSTLSEVPGGPWIWKGKRYTQN